MKRIIFILIIVAICGMVVFLFSTREKEGVTFLDRLKLEILRKESGAALESAPYQIGLVKVSIIKCLTTGEPPYCSSEPPGGLLCATMIDLERCDLSSEVHGTPAGGMGSSALFLDAAIEEAGLVPGGQLIAAGSSPTETNINGVLASNGGCWGCD